MLSFLSTTAGYPEHDYLSHILWQTVVQTGDLQELDFRFSHPGPGGPGASGFGLGASAAVLDRKAAVFLIPAALAED